MNEEGRYVSSILLIKKRMPRVNRYSLGDRSGMKTSEDGSMTIYVQNRSRGADKQSNWLPAPEGAFFLMLRTYLPGEELVKQSWQPPPVNRIE